MYLLVIYLIIINLLAFILTVSDKRRAVKHKYRIPELTLMLVAALGGSVVMYLTMIVIRHKTRHLKFMLGIPLIILVQLAIIFFLWRIMNV